MRSVLITFMGLMGLAWCSPAPVLVLVANGSDITINLSGDTSNNRLMSVVNDAGNNNPSVFDWIGGNGANKAPRLTIGGGGEPGNEPGAGNNNGAGSAALIDALLKRILVAAAEPNIRPPAVEREDDAGGVDDVKSRLTDAGAGVTRASEARTLSGTTESVVVTWSTKQKVEPVAEMEDI